MTEPSDICEIFATLFSVNAHYIEKPVEIDMEEEYFFSGVFKKISSMKIF